MLLCLSVLTRSDFDDMKLIEDFLIENNLNGSAEFFAVKDKVNEIPSIYRIALNCKSNFLRRQFKNKLKYDINNTCLWMS